MDFVVRETRWGFVTRAGGGATPEWHFVFAADLPTQVQFCRVITETAAGETSFDHALVGAYGTALAESERTIVERALRAEFPSTLVVFVTDRREGYAQIDAEASLDPRPLAAAAAVSAVTGSWDESDPILVSIGAETYRVSACFETAHWTASVK